MKKLTDKQIRFCKEYIIDLNQTQAAIRAGYSEKTAYSIGNNLLKKVEIQSYIQELKKKRSEKIEITAEQVLIELKNWAMSDITETIGLSPQQVKELPKEVRRLITKYKHTKRILPDDFGTEETIELWFVSKEKALEMINRHIGFYEVDNKQKTSLKGSIAISKWLESDD